MRSSHVPPEQPTLSRIVPKVSDGHHPDLFRKLCAHRRCPPSLPAECKPLPQKLQHEPSILPGIPRVYPAATPKFPRHNAKLVSPDGLG